MIIELDGGTIAGRASADRGDAERIEVVAPLWIRNGQIGSDATGGGGGDPNRGILRGSRTQ